MQVIEFRETPKPALLMPYYPRGNLGDLQDVSDEQYVCAFQQILIGLNHLHIRGVAHRDLKPENLLVEDPFTIIIADFGLSKVAGESLLTTFCGSLKYAAPEVFPGISQGYKPSVDIWSTAVVMLEFIYGIPVTPKTPKSKTATPQQWQQWSQRWSQQLLEKLNDSDENDDQVVHILFSMMKVDPEERWSADECLRRGCDSGLFRKMGADGIEVNNLEDATSQAESAEGHRQRTH